MSNINFENWEQYFPFKSPRTEQIDAINFILRSFIEDSKRFVIADLGTGVGKSAIAVTVARYLNAHDPPPTDLGRDGKLETQPGAWFLTTQKILQEQYLSDFGGSHGCMKSIRSSANYTCNFSKKISCSEGQQMLGAADKSSKFWKTCMLNCCYKLEKKAFIESPESVTNFSYALTESAGGSGKIGKRNLLVIDECLRGDTQIWLGADREVSIKSIFENPEITHVMSYNEATDSYESKRIMRRIRTEYDSSTRWIEITVEIDGVTKKIVTTDNHKIWTQNRGYARADELTVEDIIKFDALTKKKSGQKLSNARKIKNQERKTILYTCSNCNKVFDKNSFTRHTQTHETRNCQTCLAEFETSKLSTKKHCCHSCFSSPDQISILRSKRMSEANPSKNPESVKKSVASWKKNWQQLYDKERTRRLTIFKNAPLHQNRACPNKLEQTIVDMKIDGLKFVGLGDVWLKFLNGKNKNPDFVVNGTNKVVEVGNAQFWHPKKECLDVIEKYKEIGFECLYLTDEEIYSDPENAKTRINKHINNHNVKISNVRLVETAKNMSKKTHYKYNIEVEDNHNYFANSFLVSNCHNSDPELSRFVELAITDRTASGLGLDWPGITTHIQAVKWIKEIYLMNAQRVVLEMERDVQDFKGLEGHEKEYGDLLRKCNALKSHVGKVIKFLQVQNPDNWLFEILPPVGGSGAKITFKPIDVSPYAEDALFRLGRRVLLMSATVIQPDIFAASLGIPEDQRACLTIPTPFPVENRPILFCPIGSMASESIDSTLPKMVEAVKEILKEHKGQKGIIHCVDSEAMIKMSDGSQKRLIDVAEGEKVITWNEKELKFESSTVAANWDMGIKECINIHMENGEVLSCTRDHRILTSNRGWVQAQELTVDDDIVAFDG